MEETGPRRLAVRVAGDAMKHIRRGHPWVFDGSVESVKPEGKAGDLAIVFDDRRRLAAIGLYDPGSPIRIKVLHAGSGVPIDGDFWDGRIEAALERRSSLSASGSTTGYRLVHGENDGLPGFVADRYGTTIVVKLYSAAWFPHLDAVIEPLVVRTGIGNVVLRLARNVDAGGRADGDVLRGSLSDGPCVPFLEHGLHFEADVVRGQKTGTFLDQRDNRQLVRDRAHGARVLDVFSCNGGFSVHAAAGGAASVHSVDLSAPAIESVRRNMAANRDRAKVAACRHEATVGDALDVMRRHAAAGRTYDLIVVDPPSFASRQSQVDAAEAAYRRLTVAAIELLEDGGTLVQSSCSSRIPAHRFFEVVRAAADRAGVRLERETTTGHAVDHPVGFSEGSYLKAMFATVRRR